METKMPEQLLLKYEKSLNERDMVEIKRCVHPQASFLFTEGNFIGWPAIEKAILKTFDLIKEEKFSIKDVRWISKTDTHAACHYFFEWEGLINGQFAKGGGRGTSILIKENEEWKIIHEHLGPGF